MLADNCRSILVTLRSRRLSLLVVLSLCVAMVAAGDRNTATTVAGEIFMVSQPAANGSPPSMILSDEPNGESGEIVLEDIEPSRTDTRSLEGSFQDQQGAGDIGPNLYAPSAFDSGLVVSGKNLAMKIGGYVKADLIHDLDPIGSTDLFDTTTIPTSGPHYTNTRFHARQSRLNFDTRWPTQKGPTRIFVEADFFSEGDRWRLRHAFGEFRSVIIGQTWTTFTDMASLPQTLDNEGSVSSINRRQAQIRWTQTLVPDFLTTAVSLEDPQTNIVVPDGLEGNARTPTPDLVARVRLTREWGQFQIAGLWRQLGYQPIDGPVITDDAWGFNFTGTLQATPRDKVYYQIQFGEGIGSYKGLPDVAPASGSSAEVLPVFAWMIGWTHEWNDRWSSNFTYSENRLDNTHFQDPDELHENTYIALNLICSPAERVYFGVEYLFGIRENVDGSRGEANRLQASVIFELP